MATVNQPARGLSEAMRLRFGMVDLEPGADTLTVKNTAGTLLWSASGWHSSTLSTPWLLTTTDNNLTAAVTSNSCNAPPDGGVCNGWAYKGVTVESADYLRWQSTSKPWELSLRQPGQYYDAETGLFENWNRFYDPNTGRYLSPEPMLQRHIYFREMANLGSSLPSYAYALDNPVKYSDHNGLIRACLRCSMRRRWLRGYRRRRGGRSRKRWCRPGWRLLWYHREVLAFARATPNTTTLAVEFIGDRSSRGSTRMYGCGD
jgi:RHS repeat-associated protein